MCKVANMIHGQKSKLDLNNNDISLSMKTCGVHITSEAVQKYFGGTGGVPIDNIGALLNSLNLKVVSKNDRTVPPDEYNALMLFARKAMVTEFD